MLLYSRQFSYRQIAPNRWGAFAGFQLVAEGPSEAAVRALVAQRQR